MMVVKPVRRGFIGLDGIVIKVQGVAEQAIFSQQGHTVAQKIGSLPMTALIFPSAADGR